MNKREKILLIIAIIVLIALFGVKRVLLPTIDRFYTVIKELDESVFELEEAKLQLMSIDKYIKTLEEVNSENQQLEQFFYKGDSSDLRLEVLKFLDERINELGLSFESKELIIDRGSQDIEFNGSNTYQPTQDEDKQLDQGEKFVVKNPVKFIYRTQLKGSYEQLLSLLEDISTYHKYYSVSQLDIKASADESQLSVFIVIESYCIEGDKDESREV